MLALNSDYVEQLEAIAGSIQESDELQQFLDTEEEEQFRVLQDMYEPVIGELYEEVAKENPLQLISFERILLDTAFEGLFLPRVLAYSVLRGDVNPATMKYSRPQDHFKDILVTICKSANFELLKKRIGQTVQTGFMLSSDIWITNLIAEFENKRIRYYLQNQKVDKYRFDNERKIAYGRYLNQFKVDIFYSCDFPTVGKELKTLFPSLKLFLNQRIGRELDNNSFKTQMIEFVENEAFKGTKEHLELMAYFANFFELDANETTILTTNLEAERKSNPTFLEWYFDWLLEILKSGLPISGPNDTRVFELIDKSVADDLTSYYTLTNDINVKGYVNEEVIDSVRVFHNNYEGLSPINQCVRYTILNYFKAFMDGLQTREYHNYFELNKTFATYMQVFGNQQFNQGVEDMSLTYVQGTMKVFIDKRGKDYQEIKKFVATQFVDQGFLKDKDVVEMFKTRRKKVPATTGK
jgi:hypothetical protein